VTSTADIGFKRISAYRYSKAGARPKKFSKPLDKYLVES